VLLHVVKTAFEIDAAMHCGAWQRQLCRRFQVMNDPAVLGIRNFDDSKALGFAIVHAITHDERQPSGVVHLTAAGGIERGFAQDYGGARLLRRRGCDFLDNRIEFVDFRTVVVKAFGHDEELGVPGSRPSFGR
jgi:hypothetical protein